MPEATSLASSEAALWGRLLEPDSSELSPEAARYLLTLCFPPPDIARMHELAEKARAGSLTSSESREMETYERVGHALSLMKSKARRALKRVGVAS
ncbi:MAG TPA: hypothetical protein VLD57_09160 [Blastocatellia bacterium]|nr:hypothetical protein [Blastocatellia bacterium]